MQEILLLIALFLSGLFTAWIIGANSASPSFGPITSAGVIGIFKSSLIVGLAAFTGATLQGGAVAETMGNQLVTGVQFTTPLATIILATASILILGGIIFKYPMPTAFTLFGSTIGVGLAAGGTLQTTQALYILTFWLIIPFIAIAISYPVAWYMNNNKMKDKKQLINNLLLFLATYTAFTAGANQSGLVVGPMLNAIEINTTILLMFSGIGMMIGAWTGSPRIIQAVSREYSLLTYKNATAALLSASLIAHTGTFLGIPVSFNEIIIFSIIGSGLIGGAEKISKQKITKTIIIWILAIITSTIITYLITTTLT
ncbi:Phosphate/sulfate permease PitA [Methanonatronarchaeum thermophilum]|uniref:Phosphate/sulfate permease PitA n=1 Tax=Methanonatronarchaeum thermophilum TaxID=1927129 RepID=A0A1Y3GIV7_9EURY|nr:inorganic phosphate transporter [Methanonatronarchaeum thermophilum]OUJ19326.1 Phosphate/sulfate permease PitA [Methanonatronarchaeum thermophilum]